MNIDIKKLRELAKLAKDYQLTILKVVSGEQEWTIGRERLATHVAPAQVQQAVPLAMPPGPKEVPAGEGTGEVIPSPMVGTLFLSPSPESKPFVSPGDMVDEDTVVCIIEAMKVMNEIQAGKKGKIAEILVANAQPVEFGQPLFKIR